jgi:hypothetical protein
MEQPSGLGAIVQQYFLGVFVRLTPEQSTEIQLLAGMRCGATPAYGVRCRVNRESPNTAR